MDVILAQLSAGLAGLPMPASKDEIAERLAEVGVDEDVLWLVRAMPGDEFHFVSDVLSTARISMQMGIGRPWPEHARAREGFVSDATLVEEVQQRLHLCPETNAHLIRVSVVDGTVVLAGRSPDVPRAVMATRVACGIAPGRRIENRMQIVS